MRSSSALPSSAPRPVPGTVTAIRGIPCVDIDYTDPRVLAGNFTEAEKAFLFGVATGNTVYKQDTWEGSFGGDLFQLPAGALKFALGAQFAADAIRDVPGEAVDPDLINNIWGSTRPVSPQVTRTRRRLSARSNPASSQRSGRAEPDA